MGTRVLDLLGVATPGAPVSGDRLYPRMVFVLLLSHFFAGCLAVPT
jgi:hypothetical protein